MDLSIRWTYLKPYEIVAELAKKGYIVSKNIVRTLLKTHNYVKRNTGYITLGTSRDTSEFACDSLSPVVDERGHYSLSKRNLVTDTL